VADVTVLVVYTEASPPDDGPGPCAPV